MKPYYQDELVSLYHGDCRELAPALMGITLLVSDPPYGMGERTMRKSNGRGLRKGAKLKCSVAPESRDWPAVFGDDEPFDPSPWLRYPKVVLFGAIHYSSRLPESRAWLVWDKREGTASDDNADCDFAWTNLRGPARLYSQMWRGICRRGEENIACGPGLMHPTQKPVALMAWVLSRCNPSQRDILLDPYAGSGTTIVAAKRRGLPAIGIEIEERYCEVTAIRLAQETFNFPAELAEGGPGPAQLEIGQDTAETQSGREGK